MSWQVQSEFECAPQSVRAARDFLRAALAAWDCDDEDQVAALLTTEIVTNAILHARSAYRVAVEYVPPEVTVEVWDADPTPPARRAAGNGSETGRGLALIEALALRWGSRSEAQGKSVWFVLSCADGRITSLS